MNAVPPFQGIAPVSWAERFIAACLRALLRTSMLRVLRGGRPVDQQRRLLARVTSLTFPPRAASFESSACGGIRGETVTARNGPMPGRAILYLHGGGYCVGGPVTHRAITGRFALACDARVFAADYRLAPEHPFPAALDDAVAAYRGILAAGFPPSRVAVAGDSAGGGLAVALALRLRESGEPLPAALVLFSPWVDLSLSRLHAPAAGDPMISVPWVQECARHYLGERDPGDPLASPVHAELGGLPPVLIQVGSDEVLLNDSRRLDAALRRAGVESELQEFARCWHDFQANAGILAAADRALAAAAGFVVQRTR
jgi:acetyl esterase/lipase